MSTEKNKRLVILLHGVGSNGEDLAGLGAHWQPALPGVVFESPNAPERFEHGGGGYQWFSISNVTESNRGQRIAAARAGFDAVVSGIIERHGMSQSLDRVAFAGFSQGTIMSLDAVASGRWPVAAVLGYSGRLATPEPLEASAATRILLIHGSNDQMIPASETVKAAERLRELGLSAESRILPGIGHTISEEGVKLGQQFLASI